MPFIGFLFFDPSFQTIPLLQKKNSPIIETPRNKVKTITKADSVCFAERDKKVFKSLSYAGKVFLFKKKGRKNQPLPLIRDFRTIVLNTRVYLSLRAKTQSS